MSIIKFSFLVLFHIQPKRLKSDRDVWKMTKNMSRMCQNIGVSVYVKVVKKDKRAQGAGFVSRSFNGGWAQCAELRAQWKKE
jgi:hypothetical protein